MKFVKMVLVGLLLIVAMVFVVCVAPFLTLIFIVYIIFALPREQRLEHERKIIRFKNGHVSNDKSSFSKFLDKLPKIQ